MSDAWRVARGAMGVVLAATAVAVAPGVADAGAPIPTTETFTYTGHDQVFTVPPLVTSVQVVASGAQGGAARADSTATTPEGYEGALGGTVTTTLAVTPGEELLVTVGGAGGDASATATTTVMTASGGAAGFNGGGSGTGATLDGDVQWRCAAASGGGGGASDVRQGGAVLADRVVVAAGGGGAGGYAEALLVMGQPGGGASFQAAGDGGGEVGGDGHGIGPGGGASGGTQLAGGAHGGALGVGGHGFAGTNAPMSIARCAATGGGGGGFFGGGGGSTGFPSSPSFPGGGGGSSTPADDTTGGVRAGDGLVTITYDATPCGATFTDVGASHRFCYEIEWLARENVATGFPDGAYRPSTVVSRGAMAAFMYRLADAELPPPADASFRDVPASHPFFLEVEWVADAGIADGYADGAFRPARGVSRQAMAAFLARLAGEPDPTPPTSESFTDVSTGHPFFAEIEWLVAQEIAEGYDDGSIFGPAAPVSRQAMAAFLQRLADGPGVGV